MEKYEEYLLLIKDKYEFLELIASGTFGHVFKVKQINTGQIFAVKLLTNIFKDKYQARIVLSEIKILRELSDLKDNVFTTKVHEIILPEDLNPSSDNPIDYIFIVMDYIQHNMSHVLYGERTFLDDEHVITLMYNMLCSLNYFHSAGLMHRDIKPENILVTDESLTIICDFGLSRPCLEDSF